MKYRRSERIGIKKSFSCTNDPSTPIILDDGDNYEMNTMIRKHDVLKGIKRKSPIDGGDADMSSDDNIVLLKRKISTKKKRCVKATKNRVEVEAAKNDEHLSDDNEDNKML
ncbi:hypothetical protein QVD17_39545 [Tagetes erecta]|uniref:Uncharacterized protein n=1 Tax=Tagetes erecta TaxID=13708 RepID=A0AAD8JQ94_TARER|nr:hypothetical protein QVD17_39545 [Tagetes erecta]